MREWLLVALMLSLCFTGQVVAEEEESDPFTAAGLNLVALRNDSLDSCLLYTSPSPRDATLARMPSSA